MKKSLLLLLLAAASSSYAIEPYQAQQIEVYRAGSIEPYQAQTVKPKRAQKVTPYQAGGIEPYQGETVKPYQAETVQPHQAGSVQPRGADPVQPDSGVNKVEQGAATNVVPTPPSPPPAAQTGKGAASRGARGLIGTWQTNVPGAVYTTPSGLTGYDILHVSSGAAAGLLRINENGTYSWNSYGGKKGKWLTTQDPEYPIVIIDTVENRRWRVGYDASKGTLYVWDGSIWYEGRKATVKK